MADDEGTCTLDMSWVSTGDWLEEQNEMLQEQNAMLIRKMKKLNAHVSEIEAKAFDEAVGRERSQSELQAEGALQATEEAWEAQMAKAQ